MRPQVLFMKGNYTGSRWVAGAYRPFQLLPAPSSSSVNTPTLNKQRGQTTLFQSDFLNGLWASKDWSHLLLAGTPQAHSYHVPSPSRSALFWFENRGTFLQQP